MFKRTGFHSDTMMLSLALWPCALPLVAFVVIPFFGLKMAGIVALVLFLVVMLMCWGVCGWKVSQRDTEHG